MRHDAKTVISSHSVDTLSYFLNVLYYNSCILTFDQIFQENLKEETISMQLLCVGLLGEIVALIIQLCGNKQKEGAERWQH